MLGEQPDAGGLPIVGGRRSRVAYPALAWIPFVIAGMAVARLDPTPGRLGTHPGATASAGNLQAP
ncbi:hypothetical protein OG747_03565 [Streptomyces sp. NBC_01384]|uniref:hypothetical protein n=1 Tax=Streptomyces sp. NBC_01384 TaxID=2903847 RepID=UPI0032432945